MISLTIRFSDSSAYASGSCNMVYCKTCNYYINGRKAKKKHRESTQHWEKLADYFNRYFKVNRPRT